MIAVAIVVLAFIFIVLYLPMMQSCKIYQLKFKFAQEYMEIKDCGADLDKVVDMQFTLKELKDMVGGKSNLCDFERCLKEVQELCKNSL